MEKLLVQTELCDGCKDCEKACEGVHGVSRITIHDLEGSYYPIRCQQCEDAPCEIICPTGAMSNLGVNVEKCIACGFCAISCPFGAIRVENGNAHKCNHCAGREEGPACVQACSKRAIEVSDCNDIIVRKQKAHIEKMAGLGKKPKAKSFINVITSDTRAKKAFED